MSPKRQELVSNDAAIAQVLAKAEQEQADAEMARRMSSMSDVVRPIVVQGQPVPAPASVPRQQQPLQQQQHSPFPPPGFAAPPTRPNNNMCIVPCVMGGGTAVEMMVDTGAQTSVISRTLARELKLPIDTRHQGTAVGVGRASVVGMARDVVCELGHVEFLLDFMVLDIDEKLLLLGLDLLRRYKCIVDLERDVLVFGGKGGVEVEMLPPQNQHIALRNQINGCPMM